MISGNSASQEVPFDPLYGNPKYVKVWDLNSGAFGSVVLALEKASSRQVAIKFIERGPKVSRYVESEVLLLRRFNHPHIVQFIEVFITEKHLAIAMEFMEGGNMYEYILQRKQRLPEDEARWFFQQLVCAADYCHKMGIANRDIKLENTLLDSTYQQAIKTAQRFPLVKICDFGYSKDEREQSMPKSRVGTMDYIAPEIVLNIKGQHYDGKKSDVWAVGVLLYSMVTLKYPFRRPEDESVHPDLQGSVVLKRIVKGDFDMPTYLSPACKDLLQWMLQKDPKKRPSIKEIYNHVWFRANLPQGAGNMNDILISDERYNKGSPACSQSVTEIRSIIAEAQRVVHPPPLSPSLTEADMYLFDQDDLQVLNQLKNMRTPGEESAAHQLAYSPGPTQSGMEMVSCFSVMDGSVLSALLDEDILADPDFQSEFQL